MNNIKLVPVTPEILKRFYGEAPQQTVRAIAGVRGEEVLGIAGYFVDRARVVVFSDIPEENRKYRVSIMKGAGILLKMVSKTGMPVHAIPDANIKDADRFLKHLGFKELYKGVFAWRN